MDKNAPRPPVPFAAIERSLVTSKMRRNQYVIDRTRIIEWYRSLQRGPVIITPSQEEQDTMEFVDRKLTQDEVKAALAWTDRDESKLSTMVNETILDGYRVTFTYDVKNECITVTLIGKSGDCPNKDLAMSTRHGTVQTALLLAMYKHHVLYAGGAWGETGPESLFG